MKIFGAAAGIAAVVHIAFFPLAEKRFAALVDAEYSRFQAEAFARRMAAHERYKELAAENPPTTRAEFSALAELAAIPEPPVSVWQRYVSKLKEEGARMQLLAAGEFEVLRFAEQFGGLSGFCSQGGAHTPYHGDGAAACHAYTFPTRRRPEWLPKELDAEPEPA